MHQTTVDIWNARETSLIPSEMVGYEIEATDGSIGKVDDSTIEASSACEVSLPSPEDLLICTVPAQALRMSFS